MEVLALTFGIIVVAKGDPWQAIIGGANIGSDADTIARIGGSIFVLKKESLEYRPIS